LTHMMKEWATTAIGAVDTIIQEWSRGVLGMK
jgi:hypothetical protein